VCIERENLIEIGALPHEHANQCHNTWTWFLQDYSTQLIQLAATLNDEELCIISSVPGAYSWAAFPASLHANAGVWLCCISMPFKQRTYVSSNRQASSHSMFPNKSTPIINELPLWLTQTHRELAYRVLSKINASPPKLLRLPSMDSTAVSAYLLYTLSYYCCTCTSN
jgi:hypothetical protein